LFVSLIIFQLKDTMLLLQLNPFSRPVAITEMLILLMAAALIGWLLARFITNRHIAALLQDIEETKSNLADCRSKQQDKRSYSTSVGIAPNTLPVHTGTIRPATSKRDNLKLIEGIGPKVEELMNNAHIFTFEQLSNSSPAQLLEILRKAGQNFQMHDPTTWPEQAYLAREGKWTELEILKGKLKGGR
jgi:predicted flap endonuclease-1-like 5' DNA nuclease